MIRQQLVFDPTAVAAARRLVVGTLRGWDIPDTTIDDSELVVSELVTNAFVHGQAPSVTIELDHDIDAVTLAVEHDERGTDRDDGEAPVAGAGPSTGPVLATAEETHGRGLAIVDVLAREWGVEQTAAHRRVWCRLADDASAGTGTDADPLARLAAAIGLADDIRSIGDAVTGWTKDVFGTDFAGIALAEGGGRFLRYLSVEPLPPAAAQVWAHFPADTDAPVAAAFRNGRAYFHESGTAAVATFPALGAALEGSGMAALAHLPLVAGGAPVGTLALAWRHGRVLGVRDRELITAAAALTGAALAADLAGGSDSTGTDVEAVRSQSS